MTFKTRKKLKGSTFYIEVLPNQIVILNVTEMVFAIKIRKSKNDSNKLSQT